MNRFILSFFAPAAMLCTVLPGNAADWQPGPEDVEHHTYEVVKGDVFYDGYNTKEVIDEDKQDGVIRHTNYLHEYPIDRNLFNEVHYNLTLDVEIGALCDNYDRMGRVLLAYRPKGEPADPDYNGENGNRFEIGRFITPFMNKNVNPTSVPYSFEINDISRVIDPYDGARDFDIFLQVEVFGVPYAANKQVRGCADRQDVFSVSASFSWDSLIPMPTALRNQAPLGTRIADITPIYTAKTEIHGNVNLNNYKEGACDKLGTAARTFTFELEEDQKYSRLMLITTPHGAAENGEEYVRRTHFVYVDDQLVHTFIPGGISCEPFRKYNTQGNFIYGFEPQDDWEEWNNWCPGQAVPIRRIDLEGLNKGIHTVKISVPDAEFYGKDGDIRPSLYLLGSYLFPFETSAVEEIDAEQLKVSFTREGNILRFDAGQPIVELILYSIDGRLLEGKYNPGSEFSIADYAPGQYILLLIGENGQYDSLKLVK